MHHLSLVKCVLLLLGFAARGSNGMSLGLVTESTTINGNRDINGDSNVQNSLAGRFTMDHSSALNTNTNSEKNDITTKKPVGLITKSQERKSETQKHSKFTSESGSKEIRPISSGRNYLNGIENPKEPTLFSQWSDSQAWKIRRHTRGAKPMEIKFPELRTPAATEASNPQSPSPRHSEPNIPTTRDSRPQTSEAGTNPNSPTDFPTPEIIGNPDTLYETEIGIRTHIISPLFTCSGPCEIREHNKNSCKVDLNCGDNEIQFPF